MRLRWLALAVFLLLPFGAAAETCTFSTSGTWSSATTCTGCTPIGSPCTGLSADDSIIIPDGVVITIPDDGVPDDVDVSMTTGSITVQSGGTLIVERAGGLGLGDAGITVETGGTFQPRGQALSYGDSTPAWVGVLSDGGGADVNTAIPVGNIIHCPGASSGANPGDATTAFVTDCAGAQTNPGSRNYTAICYPDAIDAANFQAGYQQASGGTIGEGFFPELITNAAVGDIVVFWDATNKNPSRDVNAQYEVAFKNTNALNRCLVLDVRQQTAGPTAVTAAIDSPCISHADGCHEADRQIQEVTTQTAAYIPGARTIAVDTAAVVDNNQRQGRFLTCPVDYDANGTADVFIKQTVGITDTTTGATDTLRLMPGGFKYSIPISSLCHIDYGWQPGDIYSLYRPARIENVQMAACTADNTPVACCEGAAGGAGTGFGYCAPIVCGRGSTCDFDFTLVTRTSRLTLFEPTTIDNTWIRESGGVALVAGGGSAMNMVEGPGPFNRLQITSPRGPGTHYIGANGGGSTTFNDAVFRHWGDDVLTSNYCTVTSSTTCGGAGSDPDTAKNYGVEMNRGRIEYRGCGGGSCNAIEDGTAAGGPVTYIYNNVLFKDATNPIDSSSDGSVNLVNSTAGNVVSLKNTTWVANNGLFLTTDGNYNGRLDVNNIYEIGRTSTSFATTIYRASSFVDASIIDMSHTSASNSAHLIGIFGLTVENGPFQWNRVLLLDADVPATNPVNLIVTDDGAHDLSVTDFAYISPARTGQVAGSSGLWRLTSTISNPDEMFVHINRLTIALRPGEEIPISVGLWGTGNDLTWDAGLRTLRGALAVNFWTTTTSNSFLIDAPDAPLGVLSPWCGVNNEQQLPNSADLTAAYNDGRQLFVNPHVGNFQPMKGSVIDQLGCGARNVGAKDMWALRVMGHDIYAGHGDTWKVKTGGGSKRGPRATP